MLIHSFLPSSRVNGPGNRTVVWLRGCILACPGCWNPETHSFSGGDHQSIDNLAKQILAEDTDGVTFSGGEPLHQMSDLAFLCISLKRQRPDFSIGMYTGYSYKEAAEGRVFHPVDIQLPEDAAWGESENRIWWKAIERRLDFAVMGRYNQLQPCNEPLKSSKNQELKLFSDRYTYADFEPQSVEMHIDSDFIQITGFPTKELYANS